MESVREGLVEGYQLQTILGRGSHGEVYQALQESTGQVVAVKVLRLRTSPHSPPRSVQIERFRREVMACAALQHPNVVRAIDAGTTRDGQLYSVFEYVPGPTLRAVLSEHRALPIARLREFMLQTLDALASAHARGVIHRDFKPENIVVSTTGVRPNFKVLDFGVSALLDRHGPADSARLTGTGEALGTPAYAAPEQLRGETPTARTDLYAWGLVSLECMTGQPALRGHSLAEVHYRQLSPDEIALPAELEKHPLGELLRWVLCKQVERRASDTSAVYSQLERLPFDTLSAHVGYLSSESFPPAVTFPTPSEHPAADGLGERRLLTALCLRFSLPKASPGKTNGAGTAPKANAAATLDDLLQEQRRRCEQALLRAGGQLVSFAGSRALGIFGYPQANEADARNAALCAMAIHHDVTHQNHALLPHSTLQLRVSGGLHTGVVNLHESELAPDRVAGLVLAEASDLADRAKPGEILVSAASELPARSDLDFESAGEVELTTSGEQQRVFRLLGARDAFAEPNALGSLLGRARELAELQHQFQQVSRQPGRCIWLEGEAGIGKSALLHHFRAQIAATGADVIQARCLRESRRTALHPVLDMVRRELGLRGLPPTEASQKLTERISQLGLDPERLAPLLHPWLGLPLTHNSPPAFAPQRMRELSLHAFAELTLAALGPEPAIFILEDAHWCDATTREWLQTFRAAASPWPVLILLSARPGADPRTKTASAPDGELLLTGLAEDDARALINELTRDQTLEPNLITEMVHRADGVPLFLQELTRYVKSHRIVSGAALQIPNSLRELLAARLDQLGPVKTTAHSAAVIGREFDLALLQRISKRDNATLLGDIEQLTSAGLLEPQRRVAKPRYRFRHALLQAAAYDALLLASRQQLHKQVAEALENETASGADSQTLARHWAEAGEDDKALGYAKRASMDLLMRSSHLDLIEHSRLALGWVERFPEGPARLEHELDLMLPYLLAMMSVRGYAEDEVAKVVERVERLLEGAPGYQGAFNLYYAVAIYHQVQGTDRRRALQASERLAQIEVGPQHAALKIFAFTGLANCHYIDGNFTLAQSHVEGVYRSYDRQLHASLAWQFGFDAWVGVVSAGVVMDWVMGDLDKCQTRLRELESYAAELGHPESLAQARLTACILGYCRGDRAQIARATRELHGIAEENRLTTHVILARMFEAQLAADTGGATAALAELYSVGNLFGTSFYSSLLADLTLEANQVPAAVAHVERAIAHAESSGERFWFPRLLCQKAILLRRQGEAFQTTTALLDAAIQDAQRRGMLMFEIEATLARSTHTSNGPAMIAWDGASSALSRQQVTAELERIRQEAAPVGIDD